MECGEGSLTKSLAELADKALVHSFLVLKKCKLSAWNALFVWQKACKLKVVTKDKHDEGSNGRVTFITTGVNFFNSA